MERSSEGDVCTTFGANSFYGSRPGPSACSSRMQDRLVQMAKGAEYLSQHPQPSDFRPGILGPPATWKVFTRQAEAIKFSQVMGEGLMVFSFEGDAIGSGGKRNFVVTHPSQMWLRQKERVPGKRCTYEVIQEKSVCKLYFDLEFLHAHNPGNDGLAMTNTLIAVVCYFLHREFNVTCSRKNILDLTGTSPLKFSRHLIFNIPGVAFANNAHAGSFVRMVCNKIRLWSEGNNAVEIPGISLQNVKELLVFNSNDKKVLFCDEGVYSKNRNFRLFLSTKLGQNFPLIIAKENEYLLNHESGSCRDERIFFDSLITLVDSSCKILSYTEDEQLPQEQRNNGKGGNSRRSVDSDVDGIRQSPFPEIDDFIQGVIGSGYIPSWHYFSQSEVIVYNIARYRFCHNIGREHKSNNIFYVVSLKSASYYQKCHDPDCRDFRSPSWPLPRSAVFWHYMSEEDMMDWIHSVEEDVSSDEKAVIRTDTIESKVEPDNRQADSVGAMKKWDRMEEMIHSQSSQSSSKSSQGSSLLSNPWDKLSQLSSPDTSFVESLSQVQPHSLDARDHQGSLRGRYLPFDTESDEDFLKAVLYSEEQLQCVNTEMEITR